MKDYLEKYSVPEPNTGCLLWISGFSYNGYGLFSLKKKTYRAHRVSWELKNGPIKNGLFVLHKCDTPACINPDHLFLGTQKDNMKDMTEKGRSGDRGLKPLKFCRRGHEFNKENTFLYSKNSPRFGLRLCRSCMKIRSKTSRDKRKE